MKKDNKNIKEELEKLSPFLSEMKKKEDGYSTPKNYFHYLENSILEQVSLEASPKIVETKKATRSLWTMLFAPKKVASFASILMLVLTGLFLINQGIEQVNETSDSFADLTEEEILNYLASNIDDFDNYSLEEISKGTSEFDFMKIEEADTEFLFDEEEEEDLENLF